METIQLQPTDGRKSFYGKCVIIFGGQSEDKHIDYLRSYDTIVAEYNHTTKEITVYGWYSATTARHINAYLQYHGFKKASKKQLENWTPCTRDNQ